MLEVGWFSTKLLLKGKLLRNPGYFIRQSSIGLGLGLLLFVGLDKVGVTLWLPIVLSSLLTGIAMPFLLKDIKMK
ncbi:MULTISPECIES: hypothetical protein [Lyngbya]|uniref:Putative membrane protein n=1 Tax=Lyngbya aestuarii BL J TaxID=1348334 RepID=U7QA08_9CYAN|nr:MULTISPECIES: hypothetical protein [Lyngbya]EAW39025.1 hypothetical protein L8106_01882 [Lyngbya sp. PCC 8106]ERT04669.1 putative membrane protein [Lyngbya aestuarii BL J]